MLAARLVKAGQPLELQNVPVPDVEGDQALVRVAGAGVCHTDLHLLEMPGGIILPRTLGHENTGYVERLGPDATGFQEGDAVAVYGGWGCGRGRWPSGGDTGSEGLSGMATDKQQRSPALMPILSPALKVA